MSDSSAHAPVSPWRQRAVVAWRMLALVLLVFVCWPVSYGWSRLAVVLLLLLVWAGAWLLFGRRRWVHWTCFLVVFIPAFLLALPARGVNREELRASYLRELRRYDGTRYVWGGENGFGIDCSGLVRKAFINSRVRVGLRSGNGALLREALLSWWYDASARALMGEYRDETRRLFEAANIRLLKTEVLRPGDLAVTSDGVHVLAYLGNDRWIEADPHAGRVIEIGSQDPSGWLVMPVDIVRWRRLE